MNWFFRLWKRLMLLRTRNLTFKMEMECENVVSSTALDINNHIHNVLPRLRSMRVRLAQLKSRLVETLHTTDAWGNREPLAQPAFTADQVSRLQSKTTVLRIVIVLFVAGEISLYYLISGGLLSGLDRNVLTIGTWGLSLVFALSVLFFYGWSLDLLFHFIDACQLHKSNRIGRKEFNSAQADLIIGVLLFGISFGFLTYAGIARINLIENASAAANTKVADALRAVVAEGSRSTGIMAMLFTYGMAIGLGYMKRSLAKATGQYAAYKAWKANLSEQESLVKRIGEFESGIMGRIQTEVEAGVQLCHELQRIYGQQYDAAHTDLYRTYMAERAKPGFAVTKDVLNMYRPLIVVDEQLFTAAVLEKASLKALQGAAMNCEMPAQSSLDTLYAGLQEIGRPALSAAPENRSEQNGKASIDDALSQLLNA